MWGDFLLESVREIGTRKGLLLPVVNIKHPVDCVRSCTENCSKRHFNFQLVLSDEKKEMELQNLDLNRFMEILHQTSAIGMNE